MKTFPNFPHKAFTAEMYIIEGGWDEVSGSVLPCVWFYTPLVLTSLWAKKVRLIPVITISQEARDKLRGTGRRLF